MCSRTNNLTTLIFNKNTVKTFFFRIRNVIMRHKLTTFNVSHFIIVLTGKPDLVLILALLKRYKSPTLHVDFE